MLYLSFISHNYRIPQNPAKIHNITQAFTTGDRGLSYDYKSGILQVILSKKKQQQIFYRFKPHPEVKLRECIFSYTLFRCKCEVGAP